MSQELMLGISCLENRHDGHCIAFNFDTVVMNFETLTYLTWQKALGLSNLAVF